MDLTRSFSFPTFAFLARLFPLLPRRLPSWPAASTRPHRDTGDTATPAGLHGDLGLPPTDAVPPDAQSLRHDLLGRTGLW